MQERSPQGKVKYMHYRIAIRRSPRRQGPIIGQIEAFVAESKTVSITPEMRAAREALQHLALQLPMLTPAQTRDISIERGTVIMLGGINGAIFVPAFQFTKLGKPLDVVTRINRSFRVADNPLKAMHWWLTPCSGLDGTPIDAIGQIEDSLLEAAARVYRAVKVVH